MSQMSDDVNVQAISSSQSPPNGPIGLNLGAASQALGGGPQSFPAKPGTGGASDQSMAGRCRSHH